MASFGLGQFVKEPQIGDTYNPLGSASISAPTINNGNYNPQGAMNINPNLGMGGGSAFSAPGTVNGGFQNWLNTYNMGNQLRQNNPLSSQPQFENNGYNPSQYATGETTNMLAKLLGGSPTQTQIAPGSPFNVPPQNMIDFGAESPLNAGLLAERYAKYPKEVADAMTQAELTSLGPMRPSAAAPSESQFTGRPAAPNSIFGDLGGRQGSGSILPGIPAANLPGSANPGGGHNLAQSLPQTNVTNPLHNSTPGQNPMAGLAQFLNLFSLLSSGGLGNLGGQYGFGGYGGFGGLGGSQQGLNIPGSLSSLLFPRFG